MKASESEEECFRASKETEKEKEKCVCANGGVLPPNSPRLTRVRSYDMGS